MHVLTLPRARRRNDDDDTHTWGPVSVPVTAAPDRVDAPAATQHRLVLRADGVGLPSVAKLALLFYGFVFASLAGGVLMVWAAIASMGYVHRFEHFMRSIGFRGFVVSSNGVILGLIGIAGALTLLATLLTLLVACAYNIVGRFGHGLTFKVSKPPARKAVEHALPDGPTAEQTDPSVADERVTDHETSHELAEDGASHAA